MVYNVRLSEEEKSQISTVYKAVLADIDSLRQQWQIRKLRVNAHSYSTFFKVRKYNDAHLIIDGHNLCLSCDSTNKSVNLRKVRNVYQKLEFISEYSRIRNRIINQVSSLDEAKARIAKIVKSDDAIVEMEFPESINQNVVEVKKEDGRIVGTIDFGGKLVRIVTDGNIVLENREEDVKVKKKGEIE